MRIFLMYDRLVIIGVYGKKNRHTVGWKTRVVNYRRRPAGMPFMKTLSSRMNVFPCNDFFNSLGKRFVRFFEEFFILL